ncbi:MAG: DnaJ domain-containing protein [Pseudobdellovibrionaceae bacterium]
MGKELNFQQILENKIRTPGRPLDSKNPTSTQNFDPAHLAYLMGQISQSFFRPPPPSQIRKTYPSRPTPPPPPHSLSEEQQVALSFFVLQGVQLSPAFPQKELKKAFRSLALKLHPDMNKGAESAFIELKSNYEKLNRLFN